MGRKQPMTEEERGALAEQAIARLDADLEADVQISLAEAARRRRARENALAVQGLMESFALANRG